MPWYFAVAERDHEIQNPTSAAKIRLLGERLRLGPWSVVLDVACGKAGPAVLLASTFGCRIVGIERVVEFATEAWQSEPVATVAGLVEKIVGDAKDVETED